MNVTYDILLIALFAFLTFWGYLKGFIKMVLSFGRLVLSVVITVLFGSAFAGWIDQTFVNPKVYESVFGELSKLAEGATTNVSEFLNGLPEAFKGFIKVDDLNGTYESVDALVADASKTISGAVSSVIATVIGYILLFLLSFVVLTVVIFFVRKVAKLPVIKTGDKLLGLAMGAVSGLVAVSLVAAILHAIIFVSGDMSAYENSAVLKFINDINIFGFIFDKLIG